MSKQLNLADLVKCANPPSLWKFGKRVKQYSNCRVDFEKSKQKKKKLKNLRKRQNNSRRGWIKMAKVCRQSQLTLLSRIRPLTKIVSSPLKKVSSKTLIRTSRRKFISLKWSCLRMRKEGLKSSFTCLRKRNANICWNLKGSGMKNSQNIAGFIEVRLLPYSMIDTWFYQS